MVDMSTSEQLLSCLHKYVSKVQGTKQYWYQRSLELKALIQTKGAPTFFWTVSAADTYWPELQVNVYDEMDAEWHCYRSEYQSRGSLHVHGCAKLKSDPGLCQLMKKAALAWQLRDKSSTELSQLEQQIIAEGTTAQNTIIEYVDWLTTTFNPSVPSEMWRMPAPINHPCTRNPLQVSDAEQDYADLVNTVERHTKCNAAYCLRKKKGKSHSQCRFEYPRPLKSETTIEFQELPTKRIYAKVITKRNDPLINTHNKSLSQYWRANVDVQTIVDIEDCVRYMMKYAAKAETVTNSKTNL